MTINLITQEQHAELLKIHSDHKVLTFQNDGYEYIKEPLLSEDRVAIRRIESILQNHIIGFNSFTNFRMKNDMVEIRFDFNWKADEGKGGYYNGVGYILVDQLLKGFKK